MSRPTKQERLLNLVSLLLRARRPVPWEEIRTGLVGYDDPDQSDATVSRRFERDKATLREMGIPIQFEHLDTPAGGGYRIPRREAFLPRLQLSPDERAALAVVGRYARADVAGPMATFLSSALQKLQFDSPVPGDVQATVEERYLFHSATQEVDVRARSNLRSLTDAVIKNRTVRFTYYAIGADRVARRTVDPYGIGFNEGRWYLVGRSHKRRAIRNFRIDRVRGDVSLARPNASGPDFEPPPDFSLEDYLGRPPWAFGAGEPIEAVIRFSPTVAWMVKEAQTKDDTWQDNEDGGGTLRRAVTDPNALIGWVLRFGPDAEALAPPRLRDKVIEALRAVRRVYAQG